ncbi:MAG: hypothetical protein K2W99_05980 [Chthoniobacterales bacterium]|nr:hypothetical protein [Chthoniobacterales bacterium]
MKKSSPFLLIIISMILISSWRVNAMIRPEVRQEKESEEENFGSKTISYSQAEENRALIQGADLTYDPNSLNKGLLWSIGATSNQEEQHLPDQDKSNGILEEEKKEGPYTDEETFSPLIVKLAFRTPSNVFDSRPSEEIQKSAGWRTKMGMPSFPNFLVRMKGIAEMTKNSLKKNEDFQKINEVQSEIEKIEKKLQRISSVEITPKETKLYAKILATLKGDQDDLERGALGAYRAAADAEINEQPDVAMLHRRRGAALELLAKILTEQVTSFGSISAYQDLIISAWSEAVRSWRKAASNFKKNNEASILHQASALAFEAMIPELEKSRPDIDIAKLHKERGHILREAAESHEEENNHEVAAIYLKRKAVLMKEERVIKEQIKALSLSPSEHSSKKVWYWKQIANLLGGTKDNHGAAQAYLEAICAQDPYERKLRLKSASHFEEGADQYHGLKDIEECQQAANSAEEHKIIANRWGGTEHMPGAAYLQNKFLKAFSQDKGYQANSYKEASRAFEQVAEALINKDEMMAQFARERAEIWIRLAKSSELSLEQDQYQGQNQLKLKITGALEKQAWALGKQNKIAAALYEQSYTILLAVEGGRGELGQMLIPKKASGILKLKEKRLLALERQAEVLEKQAEAILSNDVLLVERYRKLAEAWGDDEKNPGVALACRWAAYAKEKKWNIAKQCQQSVLEFQKYAEHLAESDITEEELLSLQEKAKILADYSNNKSLYRKAFLDYLEGNSEGADAWNQSIKYYELYIEAENEGENQEACNFKLLAKLFGGDIEHPGLAYYYDMLFLAREEVRDNEVPEWKKKIKEKEEEIRIIYSSI